VNFGFFFDFSIWAFVVMVVIQGQVAARTNYDNVAFGDRANTAP
jgi:hypothetical protein